MMRVIKTPDPLKVLIRKATKFFHSEEAFKLFIKKYLNNLISFHDVGRGIKTINDYIEEVEREGLVNYDLIDSEQRIVFSRLLDDLTSIVLIRHAQKYPHIFLMDFNESVMMYAEDSGKDY